MTALHDGKNVTRCRPEGTLICLFVFVLFLFFIEGGIKCPVIKDGGGGGGGGGTCRDMLHNRTHEVSSHPCSVLPLRHVP